MNEMNPLLTVKSLAHYVQSMIRYSIEGEITVIAMFQRGRHIIRLSTVPHNPTWYEVEFMGDVKVIEQPIDVVAHYNKCVAEIDEGFLRTVNRFRVAELLLEKGIGISGADAQAILDLTGQDPDYAIDGYEQWLRDRYKCDCICHRPGGGGDAHKRMLLARFSTVCTEAAPIIGVDVKIHW